MARPEYEEERVVRTTLTKALEAGDLARCVEELKREAPPLEMLAADEIEAIQAAGRLLAGKAEAYYLGYLKGQPGPGGEVADAGVTIVAATVGSAVGTVVGQVVGKKMDGVVNIREQVVNPEFFARLEDKERLK